MQGGFRRLHCQPAPFVVCPLHRLTHTRTFSKAKSKSKSKSKAKSRDVRRSGKRNNSKESDILQHVEHRIHYWFSDRNLADDEFMREKMLANGGWLPLEDLCTFPALKKKKITQETIVKALTNSSHFQLGCPSGGNVVTSMRRFDLDLSNAATWEGLYKKKNENENKKKVFRSLPKYNHSRKVHISNTVKQVNTAMKRIQKEAHANKNIHDCAVISFDVEYATIEQHGPRLPAVLLFSIGRHVDIVQLDKLPGRGLILNMVPTGILDILKDPKIIKVGNGVVKDAKILLDSWRNPDNQVNDDRDLNHPHQPNSFCISGLVEIVTLLNSDESGRINQDLTSLQSLCQTHLNRKLSKKKITGAKGSKESKRSHWRAKNFTPQMITYAAEDVAVVLDLYNHIVEKRSIARMQKIFNDSTILPFANNEVMRGSRTSRTSSALDEMIALLEQDVHQNEDDDDDDS